MTTLDTTVARKDFANVVEAANKGERFPLEATRQRNCRRCFPSATWPTCSAAEDSFDREAAAAALEDIEEHGATSWDDVKARLGL